MPQGSVSLIIGSVMFAGACVLLVLRLVLDEVSLIGLGSDVALAAAGVAIAWRPIRTRLVRRRRRTTARRR